MVILLVQVIIYTMVMLFTIPRVKVELLLIIILLIGGYLIVLVVIFIQIAVVSTMWKIQGP